MFPGRYYAGFRKRNKLAYPSGNCAVIMSADRLTNCKERHSYEAPFEAVPHVAWNSRFRRNLSRRTQFGRAGRGSLLARCAASAHAQAGSLASIFSDPDPLLAHAGPSGYLGVEFTDVDADKAQALKLKEVRGAVITLIDHDAPAGQIGLKVNDVVLAINGQNVANADQLRRMLREIPPGRKIALEISRDGNIQTLAVQLVDRKALDHDVWGRIANDVSGIGVVAPAPAPMGVMGGGDAPIPSSGFHMSIFTSTLNVGALVEPLTSQMAEYLGVQGGLMVKQISKKIRGRRRRIQGL